PDTCTRSATEAPSAAATLQSVAIDGLARPLSMWTSSPLLTWESSARRSRDSCRSSRRARIRDETTAISDGSSAWRRTARSDLVTGQYYTILTVLVNIMTTHAGQRGNRGLGDWGLGDCEPGWGSGP